jgi:hypothetical protein
MNGLMASVLSIAIGIFAGPLLAQESSPKPTGVPIPFQATPPVPGMADTGMQKFLSLMNKNSGASGATESAGAPPYPMFQFNGPPLGPDFWVDPETAGRILVLQGELMRKMGDVLIEQGQALLRQNTPPDPTK